MKKIHFFLTLISDFKLPQVKKAENILMDNGKLIRSVGREAEKIYGHIVRGEGVTDKSMNARVERKKCALDFFHNHEAEFEHIKEKHLVDLDVYGFKSNQTKRDYMRRLLKFILEDIFPGQTFSGSKIFDIYRSTKRPKSTKKIGR